MTTKLETILPTLATKADISNTMAAILDAKASIVMWVTLVTLSAAALNIAVMVFMLALPQQPQVIIVPQQSPEQPQKKQ